MDIKRSPVRYGSIAIALHWISAIAIIAMLGTGFAAAFGAEAQKPMILRVHVPLGVLVVSLTIARIIWRFIDTRPGDPAGQSRWQAFAAHSVHALLYVAVLVLGASGIGLMVLSGAAGVLFLGAPGPLPDFAEFAPMAVHASVAFALVSLILVHLGAVLYHQLVRRDRILSRMGIGTVPGQ